MSYSSYENPFDYDENLADLYEKERKKSEEKGLFAGALRSGAYGLAGSTNNALAAAGRAVGLDSFAENREDAADRWAARTAGAGYKTPAFSEIDSIGDAAGWAAGAIGSNLPLLATMALTGPVSSAAGAAALGRAGLARAIGSAASKEAAKLAVSRGTTLTARALEDIASAARAGAMKRSHLSNSIAQAVGSGVGAAKVGGAAGSFIPYAATTTGENYNVLRNDEGAEGTQQEKALGAIGTGALQAGVGTLFSPMAVMNKASQVARGTAGAMTPGKLLATSALGEGATEATEQAMQQVMHNQYNPNAGYDGMQLLEAGLAGGLVGGTFAAPAAAAAALGKRGNEAAAAAVDSEGTPLPSEPRDDDWYKNKLAMFDSLPEEEKGQLGWLRHRLVSERAKTAIETFEDAEDNAPAVLDRYRELRGVLEEAAPIDPVRGIAPGWFEERARLEEARQNMEEKYGIVLTPERIAAGRWPVVNERPAQEARTGDEMHIPGTPFLSPRAYQANIDERTNPIAYQDRLAAALDATRKALKEDADEGGILASGLAEQEARLKQQLADHQMTTGVISERAQTQDLQEQFDALAPLAAENKLAAGDKQKYDILANELSRRKGSPSPNEADDDGYASGYNPESYEDLVGDAEEYADPWNDYEAGAPRTEGAASRSNKAPFDRRIKDVKPFDESTRTKLELDTPEGYGHALMFNDEDDSEVLDISMTPQYKEEVGEDGQPYYRYNKGAGTPYEEDIVIPGTLQGLITGRMRVNGVPMDVPKSIGAAVVTAMNEGRRVPMAKLFKMAQDRAEYMTESKEEVIIEPGFDEEGKLTMLANRRTITKRPSPIGKDYELKTVRLQVPAIMSAWATRKANEEMLQNGYVFVGSMDSKMFYATPEQRARLLEESGMTDALGADFNILARLGVLAKKESGKTATLDLSGITGRHQVETKDPITGKKVVTNPLDGHVGVVRGAELSQGVLRRKVADNSRLGWHYEYDKGIMRSPLQAREFDYETGSLGGITAEEAESLNASLQLGRSRASDGSDAQYDKESVWQKMKPPAAEKGGSANYQALLFAMFGEDAAAYMNQDTMANYEGKGPEALIGEKDLERAKLGAPLTANPDKILAWQTKYGAETARGYVMGSNEIINQPHDARYITPEKMEEVAEEFKKYNRTYLEGGISDVKLLPGTYKQLNKQWFEKHGRNLQPGDVLLLHRDPALPDASSISPFMFTGVATLENDYGSHGNGIVIHPSSEGWSDAAGDFDGDAGVITVPDDKWKVQAKRQLSGKLNYINKGQRQDAASILPPEAIIIDKDRAGQPLPVYEQKVRLPKTQYDKQTKTHKLLRDKNGNIQYWPPQDLISAVATARATGFSGITGQTVSQVQKLGEMGGLDTMIQIGEDFFPAWELGAALTQGAISAQKHPNDGERGIRDLGRLKGAASDAAPLKYDPETFQPVMVPNPKDPGGPMIPDMEAFYVGRVNQIKRAPLAGSTAANEMIAGLKRASAAAGREYLPFEVAPDGTSSGVLVTKDDFAKLAAAQAGRELLIRRNWLATNAEALINAGTRPEERADLAAAGRRILERIGADPDLKAAWDTFHAAQPEQKGMKPLIQFIKSRPEFKLTIEEDKLLAKSLTHRDLKAEPVEGAVESLPIFSPVHMAMAYRMREQARLYEEGDLLSGSRFHPATIEAAKSIAESYSNPEVFSYLSGVSKKFTNLNQRISLLDPLDDKAELELLSAQRTELKDEVDIYYKLGKITGPQIVAYAPQSIAKELVSDADLAAIKEVTAARGSAEESVTALTTDGKPMSPAAIVSGVYEMDDKGNFKLVEAKDGKKHPAVTLRLQRYTNRLINDNVDPLNNILALDKLEKGKKARVVVNATDVPVEGRNRRVTFHPIAKKDEIFGMADVPDLTFSGELSPMPAQYGGGDAKIIAATNLVPGAELYLAPRTLFTARSNREDTLKWAVENPVADNGGPLYQTIKVGGRVVLFQTLPPRVGQNAKGLETRAPGIRVLAVGQESELSELKKQAARFVAGTTAAAAPQAAPQRPAFEVTPENLDAKLALRKQWLLNDINAPGISPGRKARGEELNTAITGLMDDLKDPGTSDVAKTTIAGYLDKLFQVRTLADRYEQMGVVPNRTEAVVRARNEVDPKLNDPANDELAKIKFYREKLKAAKDLREAQAAPVQAGVDVTKKFQDDLLETYNRVAPGLNLPPATSLSDIANYVKTAQKLATGTPEEQKATRDKLLAYGLTEEEVIKVEASAKAYFEQQNGPSPNVADGKQNNAATPPGGTPPPGGPGGPTDPFDPRDPDGNRLPYEGATYSASIPELRNLREGFDGVKMQDTAESIGHLMGLTGAPNVVNAERMYDILVDRGYAEAAEKIAEYARTGTGYRGTHLYDPNDGTHYIYVAGGERMTPQQQAATMSHEVGHWLLESELERLITQGGPVAQQVIADFEKWATERGVDLASDTTALRKEWAADNIGMWISKDEKGHVTKALGGTDSWFREMAAKFMQAYETVKNIFSRMVTKDGRQTYNVEDGIKTWMESIAKENEDVFRAYGGVPEGRSLASVVKERQMGLKRWAENPDNPDFNTLNDLVPYVATRLDKLLGKEDAMMLRLTANAPIMRDRMFRLLSTDAQAMDNMSMNSDMAAAMMYVLATNGIMKVPEGRTYGIVQKLHRLLIQANRMAVEATDPEVDDMIAGLNGYNTRLPARKHIVPPDSPAARFYQDRRHRYARGVLGAAERAGDAYNDAVGRYLNVPYQRALQNQIPVLTDALRAAHPMAWELGGMKRAGFVELQKVKFNEFAPRAAQIITPLSDQDKIDFNNLMVPLKKITNLDNEPGSQAAKDAYTKMRAFMNAMYYYETEDPAVKAKLNIGEREDYWPMIINHDQIRARLDDVANTLTSTPYLKENWEKVREDYIKWVAANKDPGKDPRSEAERDLEVERKIKAIEEMDIPDFVRTYFKEDDDSMLPGWRFRQLKRGQVTTPGFRFANPRELDFLLHTEDPKMHEYVKTLLENDPTKVLSRYIKNAAKRVEYTRFTTKLGEMGFETLWQRAREQGATEKNIDDTVEAFDAINGMLGLKERDFVDDAIIRGEEAAGGKTVFSGLKSEGAGIMNPTLNAIRSGTHTYINVSHLTLNAATSIMDPLGTLMQTGNGKLFAQSLRNAFAEITKIQKASGMSPEESEQLAELILESGAQNVSFTNDDLNASYSGPDQAKFAQKANELFFKLNGVSTLSEMSSLTATNAAIKSDFPRMFREARGTDERAFKARRELASYGLTLEDAQETEKFGHMALLPWAEKERLITQLQSMETIPETNKTPEDLATIEAMKKELASDTRRRAAVLRYVEQSNSRPGPTTRAVTTSNPYWSLLNVWQGFMGTYDNQLMRPMMAKALQDGNGSPLLWTVATLVPVLMFGEVLRDAAKMALSDDEDKEGNKKWQPQYKDSWTFADHVNHAFTKAGFLGRNERVREAVAPLFEGKPIDALAQAGGVLTSSINKYNKWGTVPYPGRDLVNSWDLARPANGDGDKMSEMNRALAQSLGGSI